MMGLGTTTERRKIKRKIDSNNSAIRQHEKEYDFNAHAIELWKSDQNKLYTKLKEHNIKKLQQRNKIIMTYITDKQVTNILLKDMLSEVIP